MTSLPGFVKQRKDNAENEVEDQIVKAQYTLTYLCDTIAIETARNNQNDHIAILVKNVGSVFHETVEIMLGVQIDLCLKRMKGDTLEKSVRCLTDLAVDGHSLCRLLVQHGTVGQLVKILQSDRLAQHVRILLLKALGSICFVSEGIQELQETGGLDAVIDIVMEDSIDEEEQREAVGVIAQLTSPWIEGNICKEKIRNHLLGIIYSLKGKRVFFNQTYLKINYFRTLREDSLPRNISSKLRLYCPSHHNLPFFSARSIFLLHHPLSSGTSSMLLLLHLHPGPAGHHHHQHGKATHCKDPNGSSKSDSVSDQHLGSEKQETVNQLQFRYSEQNF